MSETVEVITVRNGDRYWQFLRSEYRISVTDGILWITRNGKSDPELIVSASAPWSYFVDEHRNEP